MSFASGVRAFAAQAAKERRALSLATVQPYTGAGMTTADGDPVSVFLSAVREVGEVGENGFINLQRAELRVLKTCRWQPSEGVEFVDMARGDRFRVDTATGASSAFAAEIVCQVIRISP